MLGGKGREYGREERYVGDGQHSLHHTTPHHTTPRRDGPWLPKATSRGKRQRPHTVDVGAGVGVEEVDERQRLVAERDRGDKRRRAVREGVVELAPPRCAVVGIIRVGTGVGLEPMGACLACRSAHKRRRTFARKSAVAYPAASASFQKATRPGSRKQEARVGMTLGTQGQPTRSETDWQPLRAN